MKRVASIDMGTNTFRLLIASMDSQGRLVTHYSENQMVRLGEGFSEKKHIGSKASARAISSLRHFKDVLNKEGIVDVILTGTSALREAENSSEFLAEVRQETGFEVEVLSGEDEAKYTLRGVRLVFKDDAQAPSPIAVLDIGGGSTELILEIPGRPLILRSFPLGAVYLTETYLHSDPPTQNEVRQAKNKIEESLDGFETPFPSNLRLIGTAGTITTLAAIKHKMKIYAPEVINETVLYKTSTLALLNQLMRLPLDERRRIDGLEKGRADILIAGILILLVFMDKLGFRSLHVSDAGLREGVFLNHLFKVQNGNTLKSVAFQTSDQ